MQVVSCAQEIQVVLFGTFWNFFEKYFWSTVGWIHRCRTCGFRGQLYFPKVPIFWHSSQHLRKFLCASALKSKQTKGRSSSSMVLHLSPCSLLRTSFTATFQEESSTCSFHLLTPSFIPQTPTPSYFSQISPGTSHFQTNRLFTSLLLRPLCGRWRHPSLLPESLPSPGFRDGVFVGLSSPSWHFLLTGNCMFVFHALFFHLLLKYWCS